MIITHRARKKKEISFRERQLVKIAPINHISNLIQSANVTFLNCRSICNKTLSLHDYIDSNQLDVFAIAETWTHESGDETAFQEMMPEGYAYIHAPRVASDRGGGIAVVHKSNLDITLQDSTVSGKCKQFELLDCIVHFKPQKIRLVIVYRPPPSKKNGLRLEKFWKEWTRLLENLSSLSYEVLIVGDLNLHLDLKDESATIKFVGILEEFGYKQHVMVPTHIKNHTLDVLITKERTSLIESLEVRDPGLCNSQGLVVKDHFALNAVLHVSKPAKQRKTIRYRDFGNLNQEEFRLAVRKSNLTSEAEHLNTGALIQRYNGTLTDLLDQHAPFKTKQITVGKIPPWSSQEINLEKRIMRRRERLWRKTKLTVHYDMYKTQSAKFFSMLQTARIQYCSKKVEECGTNQKKIFRFTNSLLGRKTEQVLPKTNSDQKLANDFMDYFTNKIKKIHRQLESSGTEGLQREATMQEHICQYVLESFDETTEDEVRRLILQAPNKQCPLDPLPTWLLKILLDELLPLLVLIINKSMSEGEVPQSLKTALIRPLIKDFDEDRNSLANYRPVSNLPFVSKLLERVIHSRLDNHFNNNELNDEDQTAYSKYNSTETCLMCIQNDILENMDNNRATILVMLDLSAAYDTISHDIFLKRLEMQCGVKGTALKWMGSYLKNRVNQVIIRDEVSRKGSPDCGAAQGSVMGGKCYNVYTAPLGRDVIKNPVIKKKAYADDKQFYTAFVINDCNDLNNAVSTLEDCVADVKGWMQLNMLQLNDDKTKLIVFAPKKFCKQFDNLSIRCGPFVIKPIHLVKNLGVLLDSSLTMEKHINKKTKSAYFQIKNIWTIRKSYLNENATRSLVNALVTPKLDYCNGLLAGLPLYLLQKLQRVQNASARLIKRTKKRSHITPVLKQLHWLPVKFRIKYKIMLTTFKALHGLAPSYIACLLPEFRKTRSDQLKFYIPRYNFKKLGGRAFRNIAPSLWNQLPLDIRSVNNVNTFKGLLKTFYFRQHFGEEEAGIAEDQDLQD